MHKHVAKHMKNTFLLLIFIVFSQNINSQNNSDSLVRSYKISLIERPQSIELFEYENGHYSGNIITEITQGKWEYGWLKKTWRNLWNIKDKEITDKNPIDEHAVKELMFSLKKNGIETIKKCSEDKECNKSMFLDSGSISFEIKTSETEKKASFEEIYPLNGNNKEKFKLRFKAQNLITIIYKHVDFKQNFADLFKRLPRGYYNWYQASGHSIVTIKNRKRKK